MLKRGDYRLGLALLVALTGCGGHSASRPGDGGPAGQGGAAGTAGTATVAMGSGGLAASGDGTGGSAGAFSAAAGAVATGLVVLPSTGCGLPAPAEQVPSVPGSRTGYTEWHVAQTGATLGSEVRSAVGERQFFVRVPADYDANKPYRVVYIAHGCGAVRAGKTNTYPLFDEAQGGAEQAVYVGLSVADQAIGSPCYDISTGGQSQEWEAFELIHAFVEQRYCVDNNRIFVAGYSSGSWIANMWGCYFGGVPTPPLDQPDVDAGRTERKFAPHWAIRGHVGVTGSLPPNAPRPCNGPSAGLWLHDALDKSNLIETNISALELALETNGCTGNYADGPKRPWAPAENIAGLAGGICQEYTGCPAEVAQKYPLVFCTTSGLGHASQASSAIPAFTRFFALMDPQP